MGVLAESHRTERKKHGGLRNGEEALGNALSHPQQELLLKLPIERET